MIDTPWHCLKRIKRNHTWSLTGDLKWKHRLAFMWQAFRGRAIVGLQPRQRNVGNNVLVDFNTLEEKH